MLTSSYTNWICDSKNALFREHIQSVYNTRESVNVKNASIGISARNNGTITVNYSIVALKVDDKKTRNRRRSEVSERSE